VNKLTNISIKGISFELGENEINVDSFKKDNEDWDLSKIISKTGINKVFYTSSDQTAVDLAVIAINNFFLEYNFLKSEIDGLIFVTQSPDYVLPTSACLIQDRSNLPKQMIAFDINLGCSGFVKSLSVASSLINSGTCNNCLIVTSETYSKYISKGDRTNKPLFSDGASVTLVSKGGDFEIGPSKFGVDGSGAKHLIVYGSGAKHDESKTKNELYMNGSEVFLFTISTIPNLINKFFNENNLSVKKIDKFYFHQASKLVLDAIGKKLEIPEDKLIINNQNIGNTVSSTIPISLKLTQIENSLNKGDLILIIGFGVGLSYGLTLIKWGS
jgi:3-oxoacyl-[acyl-carrier-protein] synthase III